jgi:hypothetical protein
MTSPPSLSRRPPQKPAAATAWDATGDPIRLTAGFYTQYDKAPLLEVVERALGRRDGQPIPVSLDNPGAPIPYQPDTRGMAGTYAATSLPAKRDER